MKYQNKNKERSKKSKKAQEEMVGFAVIIVLVIIIGVVFLGFSLRQGTPSVQHQESMMIDTMYSMLAFSCCEGNARELVKDCYVDPTRECDGKPVCEYTEELFTDILDKTLGDNIADSFIHGYMMNISTDRVLVYSEKGTLSGSYFGATVPIPIYGEDIDFSLRFYYSSVPEQEP